MPLHPPFPPSGVLCYACAQVLFSSSLIVYNKVNLNIGGIHIMKKGSITFENGEKLVIDFYEDAAPNTVKSFTHRYRKSCYASCGLALS